MARWQPPSSVGPNEQIGRRLFDEPMLKGTPGQPSYSGVALYHFEETRDTELSLDRLGKSGVDRKVQKYLAQRAEIAGKKFQKPKRFDGWFRVSAKDLTKPHKEISLPIFASPIEEDEPEDNIYHAHIARPNGLDHYIMALHLRHIFITYGQLERKLTSTEKMSALDSLNSWIISTIQWTLRIFRSK